MNRVDRAPGVRLVTDYPGVYEHDEDRVESLPEWPVPGKVECLLSRLTAGLGVQALVADGEAYITVTLNGATETFPVPPNSLLDAFEHPFAYGATLPL
jgi:hypothetical protein